TICRGSRESRTGTFPCRMRYASCSAGPNRTHNGRGPTRFEIDARSIPRGPISALHLPKDDRNTRWNLEVPDRRIGTVWGWTDNRSIGRLRRGFRNLPTQIDRAFKFDAVSLHRAMERIGS